MAWANTGWRLLTIYATFLCAFAGIFANASLPREIQVDIRIANNPPEPETFIHGILEIHPSFVDPSLGRGLLRIGHGIRGFELNSEQMGMLLSERFHETVAGAGFLIPTPQRPGRVMAAARNLGLGAPGIQVDLDAAYELKSIGLWVHALNQNGREYGPQELWPIGKFAKESAWQQLWVLENKRWNTLEMPDLIVGQALQMQHYPLALTKLADLLSDPLTEDDVFFGIRAAQYLGIDEEQVRKHTRRRPQEPLKTSDWVETLRHRAAHKPARVQPVPSLTYAALTSPLGKRINASVKGASGPEFPSLSLRLRRLAEILRARRTSDELETCLRIVESLLYGRRNLIQRADGEYPRTQADLLKAVESAQLDAEVREARAEIDHQMQLKTARDRLQILFYEIQSPVSPSRLRAAMVMAQEMLGGETVIRGIVEKPEGQLLPVHYRTALEKVRAVTPEEAPQPVTRLSFEERSMLEDWEAMYFPVKVDFSEKVRGYIDGKVFVRGGQRAPLGQWHEFATDVELVFPVGRGHETRLISRQSFLPEIWVLRLPESDRLVLFKREDGSVQEGWFEYVLFKVMDETVASFFAVKTTIDGQYATYLIPPEEVFPKSCELALLKEGAHRLGQ